MGGFCYQENTHFSQALPCTKEVFWEQVRKPSTEWRINARRAIIAAVEASKTEGPVAIQTWLNNTEYQRFLLKKQKLKKEVAKKAWAEKTDAEKLMAFAQDLKDNLPAFIFGCYEFDETPTDKGTLFRHRRLADCHLNGLFMLDIDHVENPMQIWWRLRDNEELMKRIALVHITSSGYGARIVGVADGSIGNLADNQIVMAEKLGYKADESCIDATRNSFAPKEDDILYINEELLFDYYDEEFDKRYTQLYREKETQPLYHEFPSDDEKNTGKTNTNLTNQTNNSCNSSNSCSEIKWHGYDIQSIIDQRFADKLPCADDSNRHKQSLILATDLLLMFDGDKQLVQRIVEAQSWVQEIIAARDENVAQTVESAAKQKAKREETTSNPYPSTAMQNAIKAVTGFSYKEITKSEELRVKSEESPAASGNHTSQFSSLNSQLDSWGSEIEALFPDFPMLKDVCTGLKRSQYPAAMFVAGGVLMTLMTRCWYRFYHRPQQERRLNCSLYIIGHPASNKSMADDINDVLITPMQAADAAGKAALNRYKKENKKKAANKEGKDKPQGIIRIHPSRTSNGQLIEDMLNAKEMVDGREMYLHMYTFDTELDNSITLQSGGQWINKQAMELKAFHNEKDGQMYQNQDSPVEEFHVLWNYIYSGTLIALKKKVNERNFGSGLSTRLTVIPMPKTNYEMIAFEDCTDIDWQRIERMKSWAYKLDGRYGELPLWPLVKRLYDWTNNRMDDCREDNSEANELMLKRVPYHALNFSAPFIDMRHWDQLHQEGSNWTGTYEVDDVDWRLCELIARIQYAMQQHFFGTLAEKYFDDMNNDVQFSGKRHHSKSIEGYNRLPEVFTKDDIKRCFGKDSAPYVCMKIRRLTDDNLIEEMEDGKYRKKVAHLV